MADAKHDPVPEPSGEMKRIKITMSAEGYGTSEKEWMVPVELLRPYAIAYDAGISALGLKISKEIYEALIAGGQMDVETYLAVPMTRAAES